MTTINLNTNRISKVTKCRASIYYKVLSLFYFWTNQLKSLVFIILHSTSVIQYGHIWISEPTDEIFQRSQTETREDRSEQDASGKIVE